MWSTSLLSVIIPIALHNLLQVYIVRLPRAACLAVEAAKQALDEAFARAVLDERCKELMEQVDEGSCSLACVVGDSVLYPTYKSTYLTWCVPGVAGIRGSKTSRRSGR
jgi:precorrin-2 methylase